MKSNWFKNFKSKFKIVIIHPDTYEEKGGFNMSKMRITNMIIIYSLILITVTTCLIFFTSLREFIPGYTDATLDRRVYTMERRADSIEEVFRQKDQYIENMRRIIGDDDNSNGEMMITPLNIGDPYLAKKNFEIPMFFVPVNGMVTNHFNRNNKHFGVDVVSGTDVMIKATADGTVIFSDWSSEGGYVIGIQHDNNIVSVYKHNASVMCREGDIVRAGDAIAVLGGGGSTSTGPHLHFELWFKGMPINPEDYISFEGK